MIAINWGLRSQIESQYDPLVDEARANTQTFDICVRAAAKLEQILAGQSELVACRSALSAAKRSLGKATLAIHLGAQQPKPGSEQLVEPFEQLCRSHGDLRRKCLLGNRAGWIDFREGRKWLVEDARKLVDAAANLVARSKGDS